MDFKGKVAIVTGSSSGIGAATAIEFAKHGADVVIVGRNQEKLNNVASICEKSGKKPLIINADITKDDQAKNLITEAVNKFGRIDILVNNVGMWKSASIESEDIMQVYDAVLDANLRSMFHVTHLAVPHLIKSQGNIINISSVAALKPTHIPTTLTYCVSKAAVDHFSKCIALDLASKGVRVNIINPGPVKTYILDNAGLPNEAASSFWESMKESTALKRVSEPKEIADLILFLTSEKAVGITGASIVSDNGALLK